MRVPDETLYLIDSSIYVFRAWQALPDTTVNLNGQPANAVIGFCDFLLQVLNQTQATYIACAFDKRDGPPARKKIYPPYKANRSPTPPALVPQFIWCQQLAELLGIPQFSSGPFEADDIIGTLSHTARALGKNVSIVSADKDLTQFIREGDEFWNFARNLSLDAQKIKKRFGVAPEQIPDMLALSGDKVDNIPGIPGVGTATAAKLLTKWGTLDDVFNHATEVANMKFRGAEQVSKLLKNHEKTVMLSRKLTGLLHVDGLPESMELLKRKPVNYKALNDFLSTMGLSVEQITQLNNTLEAGNGRYPL